MGTETVEDTFYIFVVIFSNVKLNNPLMGTETKNYKRYLSSFVTLIIVKLNNPLMGTETIFSSIIVLLVNKLFS